MVGLVLGINTHTWADWHKLCLFNRHLKVYIYYYYLFIGEYAYDNYYYNIML